MVLGVLNQAFDVLVLRYGVQKRIYCNVSAPPPPSPPPHTHTPSCIPARSAATCLLRSFCWGLLRTSLASSGQELRPRTLLSLSSLGVPSCGDGGALCSSLSCGPCWDTVAESVEAQTLLPSPPSTRPTQQALPRDRTVPAWDGGCRPRVRLGPLLQGPRHPENRPLPNRYRTAGYAGFARLDYGNTGGGKTRKDGPWPLWK